MDDVTEKLPSLTLTDDDNNNTLEQLTRNNVWHTLLKQQTDEPQQFCHTRGCSKHTMVHALEEIVASTTNESVVHKQLDHLLFLAVD